VKKHPREVAQAKALFSAFAYYVEACGLCGGAEDEESGGFNLLKSQPSDVFNPRSKLAILSL